MLCTNAEYEEMDQDLSLGQLYDVHNETKIYTKYWLGLLIYYSTTLKYLTKLKMSVKESNMTQKPAA
jgi:hypothetical protein